MMPDPLHPAVAHFPIAFSFLTTLLVLISFFWKERTLGVVSFGVLLLTVVGIYLAQDTGGDAAELFLYNYPEASGRLHEHATWADRSFWVGVGLMFVMLMGMFMGRNSRVGGVVRMLVLIGAVGLNYGVFMTGKLGGKMVYGDALKLEGKVLPGKGSGEGK